MNKYIFEKSTKVSSINKKNGVLNITVKSTRTFYSKDNFMRIAYKIKENASSLNNIYKVNVIAEKTKIANRSGQCIGFILIDGKNFDCYFKGEKVN
ncbi:MAG: hypothetical protein FH761_16660 [Firmicutes bacterium]|nr:hypothetical protein [Bacillota bacterium]